MGRDLGKHRSRKKMSKFDSFMKLPPGEEAGSEGEGDGESWEVRGAFAEYLGQQHMVVRTACT